MAVIIGLLWLIHHLWISGVRKDIEEDIKMNWIEEIRTSPLNIVVSTEYSQVDGIVWDFFDKYLVLKNNNKLISIP